MSRFTTTAPAGTAVAEVFDPAASYRTYDPDSDANFGRAPPEIELVPIINKTITQCVRDRKPPFKPQSRDSEKRKTFVIHPSSAAGCRRKVFFGVVGARQDMRPPDPEMERIFAMGHQAHERIQGYLFEAWKRNVGGVNRAWEDVKLKVPDIGASGELDSITQILAWRYLVEIKTCSDSVYRGTVVPKQDWVWQTHIYMKGVGLKAAILLMECRNNGKMRQFFIRWDDKVWDDIELKTLEVLAAVEAQEVTEKTDDRSECYWCKYTEICKSPRMQGEIDYGRVHLPVVA